MYRREQRRLYGGWGMLKAVVRRNDFATAEAPDGAMLLLFASEGCCTAVDSSLGICAWHYALSK